MRLLLFTLLTLSLNLSYSQIDHSTDTLSVGCTVTLFDEGGDGPGVGANYANNLSDTLMLVFPNYVTAVQIEFPLWDMESADFDTVSFFSGTTNNLIGHYATASPPTLMIANDTVIICFLSDVATTEAGFEMTLTGLFNSSIITSNDITCSTVNNSEIVLSGDGGVSPYQYSNDSAATWQASNTFSGLIAGSYDDLLIRDTDGCIDSIDAITIADISTPFTFSSEVVTDITCNALTNGSISIVVSGSSGIYDFAWSTGFDDENSTNSSISALAQNGYTVTISDAADTTCRFTKNYTILEPTVLSETHFIQDTISCNNNCDGSIAITALGGVAPYQYSDNGGTSFQSSNILDSLCAATISYVVRDNNGCTVGGNQIIVEPAVLTITTIGTDPTANGSNDGFVNSTPSGGTTPYTYLWNTGPVQTTQNATGLAGGTFTVTVTDSNGCTAQSSEVLFEPALFVGGAIEFASSGTFFELVCHGNSTSNIQNQILPTGGAGGYTYSWQWSTDLAIWNNYGTPTTISYGTHTPTQDIFIRRRATDISLATAFSNAVTVNYIEEVFPAITGLDTTYCQNDDFVVMNGTPASGTSYFTINGFDSLSTSLAYNPTDTILQDTTYNIDTNIVSYTYLDNNGCIFSTNTFEFYIYDTVFFDLEFFQSEYILGEANVYMPGKVSPFPTGGVGFFEGPGSSGDSLYLDIAGLGGNKAYRFTYTDTTGCVSTDTDSINIVTASAIVGLGDALFCNNEGLIPISAIDPKGATPQPWLPSTPNYPNGPHTYNSGFKLFDASGADISGVLTNNGVTACCVVTDNDGIDLSILPITPGQFLDTFKLQYRYQNKFQNGIYVDWITINMPWPLPDITFPFFYPTYGKKTYKINRWFYVEHLNSAGNFANLTPPYCANIDPVNIIAENQDPLGGISEWTITGAPPFTNDGLSNTAQTTVIFDPEVFDGALNTVYTINYLYKSPLEQCSQTITGNIEVSSVSALTLTAQPLNICLGLTDTLYGFANGNPVGNFSGNNINNGTLDDGVAILNTSTGPAINEPITFTFTDLNGCLVDSTWLFTVFDEPVVSFINTVTDICFGDSILFEGLGDGNANVGNFYTNLGILDTTVLGLSYFNSALVTPDSAYAYTFEFTDLNGCVNSISNSLYVNDLPVANITVDGGFEFCSNDTTGIIATPVPGPNDSIFYAGTYEPYVPSGFYTIIANNYPTGIVYVDYYFIDNNGCTAYAIDSLLVYPTPIAGFSFNSNCITDTIDFIDTTITNGATISDYSWSFSDGFASSAQDTSVLFQYGGQKVISFEVTSSAGCRDQFQLIEWFGEKPRVDFDWTNECLIGAGSNTQFVNNTPAIDSVTIWSWSFGDLGNSTSSLIAPLFNYTIEGSYLVTLIGETDYGCVDTVRKPIWIRDYVQSYPYLADFESGNYGWVPDTLVGLNNSWELGVPSGTVINTAYSGANVLMTGLNDNHNNDEYSFIVSPCFDFSQLKRPMIKIKYWSETNIGDGVQLEHGDQGGPWDVIGELGKGIDWYNETYVDGLNEFAGANVQGWSGSTGGWIDARYQLDTLVGDNNVRIKIIFGSNQAQTLDGFAIDDIWIGERERTVLVEHFTSYDDVQSQTSTPLFNAKIDDPYLNDFSMDLVNVQYHTSVSSTETLNLNYQAGPAARTNYYGLDSIPYVLNDGISFRGTVSSWLTNIEKLEARTLIDPQFNINLNVVQTGANIDVAVVFTANEDLGNEEVTVRIAIVEDSVDLSGQTPSVPGIHRNTLLNFLPGASGRSYFNNWTTGTSDVMNESWTITNAFNLNNIDAVVWIQNKATKEVYQAQSGTISTLLGLTGVHQEGVSMDFIIYPNPSNGASTLLLNNGFNEAGEIVIHDASGRMVEKIRIAKFQESVNLSNANYKNGMYFVSVVSPSGKMLTKKMILNKN